MPPKQEQHNPEHHDADKVERLKVLLSKFHATGEGDTLIQHLISDLKESKAEIISDLAKDNATIWSMFGGPTLALATDDDTDIDDQGQDD